MQHRAEAPTGLEVFNSAASHDARRALLACCRSLRWAHRVAEHRPYPDLGSLLAAADEAAYDLTPADLSEALAGESLMALPDGAYSAARTALDAAHAAYECRFGHVFIICLDDVAPEEAADRVLAAIRSRLANDPEEERLLAAEELRRLARGRLTRLLRARCGRPRCTTPPEERRTCDDARPRPPATGGREQPPPGHRSAD